VPPARHSGRQYCGRFAPSPTGELHLGSLLAALASYLQARSQRGRWLVRIEDIDPAREVSGSARSILASLENLGLVADAIVYQSQRSARYQERLAELRRRGLAYGCGCSRRHLTPTGHYPGYCRHGMPPGYAERSVRLRVPAVPIRFDDGLRGPQSWNLARAGGDFVIRRADGLHAYQLAAAVDDGEQDITEVVRGADLLDSTPRQIWVMRCLRLTPPRYVHVPVLVDANGAKLSKSAGTAALTARPPAASLGRALRLLRHPPPARVRSVDGMLCWAVAHWDLRRVPQWATIMAGAADTPTPLELQHDTAPRSHRDQV